MTSDEYGIVMQDKYSQFNDCSLGRNLSARSMALAIPVTKQEKSQNSLTHNSYQ